MMEPRPVVSRQQSAPGQQSGALTESPLCAPGSGWVGSGTPSPTTVAPSPRVSLERALLRGLGGCWTEHPRAGPGRPVAHTSRTFCFRPAQTPIGVLGTPTRDTSLSPH